MSGPYSIEELENEIYKLVVSSKSREGESFPTKYVWLNMEKNGYTKDDFVTGAESLKEKGLLTKEEKISNDFFDVLGSR
jgi:hypothetical protein